MELIKADRSEAENESFGKGSCQAGRSWRFVLVDTRHLAYFDFFR
jgi:hypothetical protein